MFDLFENFPTEESRESTAWKYLSFQKIFNLRHDDTKREAVYSETNY